MTQLAELDERVERLTVEVVDIRGVATKAGIDAADVRAQLRGHTRTLEALRETQVEQGRQISDLRSEMRAGFARVDERFAGMDERFVSMEDRFTGMEKRFTRLEGEMKEGFATVGVELAKISTLLRVAIRQPGQPVES
jgi:chromosome segregation ATPase